jgi:peptide/nickel transport system substrate-binding protein
VRSDTYFRERPQWERVTIRFIPNDAARVAALLAGDVDLVDSVPLTDARTLASNPRIALHTGPSARIMFIQFDVSHASTPTATDANGQPLPRNPFQDVRVRRALSLAVNREALVERVMDGFGVPTNQFAVPGLLGYDPSIPREVSSPEQARALLREAGYPNGFGLTVNCPNNRYPNDSKVCQAVGQMFARAGLRIQVEPQPMNVFFPRLTRANGPEVSAWLLGLGASQGEASATWLIFHSPQREIGLGQFNFGGFSDPELDRLIDDALATVDRAAREPRLQAAMRRATELHATLPLLGLSVVVATRRGLAYPTATNEHTLAMRVRPAQ